MDSVHILQLLKVTLCTQSSINIAILSTISKVPTTGYLLLLDNNIVGQFVELISWKALEISAIVAQCSVEWAIVLSSNDGSGYSYGRRRSRWSTRDRFTLVRKTIHIISDLHILSLISTESDLSLVTPVGHAPKKGQSALLQRPLPLSLARQRRNCRPTQADQSADTHTRQQDNWIGKEIGKFLLNNQNAYILWNY